MYLKKITGPRAVELPDGSHLSRSDLPPKTTSRWVASRKATVVKAVAAGLIDLDEACDMYEISKEEFESWCKLAQKFGEKGLKTTAIQQYRTQGTPHN